MTYSLWSWKIDFEKVQTLEDVKTILRALDVEFGCPSDDLKRLCTLRNKQTGEAWESPTP